MTSIRFRLPLSYAVVSLLAALVLGGALILPLQEYYARRERSYLSGHAHVIAAVLGELLSTRDQDLPSGDRQPLLERNLKALSLISRSRVRVLDAQRSVWADSGSPALRTAIGLDSRQDQVFFLRTTVEPRERGVPIGAQVMITTIEQSLGSADAMAQNRVQEMTVTANTLLYDMDLEFNADGGGRRSLEQASAPISAVDGRALGYVELTEGPAYGADVVDAVLRGWALASIAAVALATCAGWWISLGISKPLVQLTAVAARMAAGDLRARNGLGSDRPPDEIGVLARTLDAMAGKVNATVDTLRTFVADAAHEINTPLMALQNQLELAENAPSGETAAHVAQAREQAERMAVLSRSLLDLSRLEANGSVNMDMLDLAALARDACAEVRPKSEQLGVVVHCEPSEGVLNVVGREPLLRMALGNVLDNALKFMPAGGEVRVALDRYDGKARVRVCDTGIGIPPDELSQVFARFHRARNATQFAGNGLGLSIVDVVIGMHGGSVRASNRAPGPGVCVEMQVPLTRDGLVSE